MPEIHKLIQLDNQIARIDYASLFDIKNIRTFYEEYIGEDTANYFVPFIANICGCLLDTSHILTPKNYVKFKVLEDRGVNNFKYGNAGGGLFSGPYRSFFIEDIEENKLIVNFAISTYVPSSGKSIVQTVLNVAIEGYGKKHHALEYVFNNDNLVLRGDNRTQLLFKHTGRIAVGKQGSGKISELKELIDDEYPSLLINNQIILGELNNKELFYVDTPEFEQLIENLIIYSLIRDKYRRIKS